MRARSDRGARRLPQRQGCAAFSGALQRCAVLLGAALALSVSSVGPVFAQSTWPDLGFPLAQVQEPTRILVLDQERLFAESRFGRRVGADIDARSREVVAENRKLESQLEDEERALTAQRPKLEPAEFRARADAFNAKVQRIRAEQDAKARALATFRESEQQRFSLALAPVLTELAAERSAVAILDKRLLLIAADSIDITLSAIERVDALIGEGGSLPAGPSPEAAPPGFGDIGLAPDFRDSAPPSPGPDDIAPEANPTAPPSAQAAPAPVQPAPAQAAPVPDEAAPAAPVADKPSETPGASQPPRPSGN